MAALEQVSAVFDELDDLVRIVERQMRDLNWYRTRVGEGNDPPTLNISAEITTLIGLRDDLKSSIYQMYQKVVTAITNDLLT